MEQLSCWTLFHLSPILKVITGLHSGPWNFLKLRLGPCLPPLSVSLCSLSPPTAPRRPPPRWVAPGQVRLRLRFTWRPHELLDPAPRALELPPFATPPPKLRAAATATPPWRARCTTPGRQLARAPASGEPEHSILCALSLAPCSGSPEHYRLRHYRPSSELAADSHPPPFPPAINPANRSASLSRSSLTSSRRLSYTKKTLAVELRRSPKLRRPACTRSHSSATAPPK